MSVSNATDSLTLSVMLLHVD